MDIVISGLILLLFLILMLIMINLNDLLIDLFIHLFLWITILIYHFRLWNLLIILHFLSLTFILDAIFFRFVIFFVLTFLLVNLLCLSHWILNACTIILLLLVDLSVMHLKVLLIWVSKQFFILSVLFHKIFWVSIMSN